MATCPPSSVIVLCLTHFLWFLFFFPRQVLKVQLLFEKSFSHTEVEKDFFLRIYTETSLVEAKTISSIEA